VSSVRVYTEQPADESRLREPSPTWDPLGVATSPTIRNLGFANQLQRKIGTVEKEPTRRRYQTTFGLAQSINQGKQVMQKLTLLLLIQGTAPREFSPQHFFIKNTSAIKP
jgi:hypothetical protein